MKQAERIFWGALAIALVILLLRSGCNDGGSEPCPTIDTTSTYRAEYDSILRIFKFKDDSISPPKIIHVKVPYPVEIEKSWTAADTQKIVAFCMEKLDDYYSQKFFELNHRDTNLVATAGIYISENKLDSTIFSYKWLKPVEIETKTVQVLYPEPKRNKILIGGTFGGSMDGSIPHLEMFAPKITLLTKQDNAYGISYDIEDYFIQKRTVNFYIDASWKISFRKRRQK